LVCSAVTICQNTTCVHYWPHEKRGNCTTWCPCSFVQKNVRCTKVRYQ